MLRVSIFFYLSLCVLFGAFHIHLYSETFIIAFCMQEKKIESEWIEASSSSSSSNGNRTTSYMFISSSIVYWMDRRENVKLKWKDHVQIMRLSVLSCIIYCPRPMAMETFLVWQFFFTFLL